MAQRFDIVKARPDRNDPEKTYWDPIGTLFAIPKEDGVELPEFKLFGQIFAIGDVQVFPHKDRDASNPF